MATYEHEEAVCIGTKSSAALMCPQMLRRCGKEVTVLVTVFQGDSSKWGSDPIPRAAKKTPPPQAWHPIAGTTRPAICRAVNSPSGVWSAPRGAELPGSHFVAWLVLRVQAASHTMESSAEQAGMEASDSQRQAAHSSYAQSEVSTQTTPSHELCFPAPRHQLGEEEGERRLLWSRKTVLAGECYSGRSIYPPKLK